MASMNNNPELGRGCRACPGREVDLQNRITDAVEEGRSKEEIAHLKQQLREVQEENALKLAELGRELELKDKKIQALEAAKDQGAKNPKTPATTHENVLGDDRICFACPTILDKKTGDKMPNCTCGLEHPRRILVFNYLVGNYMGSGAKRGIRIRDVKSLITVSGLVENIVHDNEGEIHPWVTGSRMFAPAYVGDDKPLNNIYADMADLIIEMNDTHTPGRFQKTANHIADAGPHLMSKESPVLHDKTQFIEYFAPHVEIGKRIRELKAEALDLRPELDIANSENNNPVKKKRKKEEPAQPSPGGSTEPNKEPKDISSNPPTPGRVV